MREGPVAVAREGQPGKLGRARQCDAQAVQEPCGMQTLRGLRDQMAQTECLWELSKSLVTVLFLRDVLP